ncbi:MAG: hypothetical protein GX418_10335 [Clostridiales bacterium]|nr:hypothetical protein [Clostridiales bacterium]
MKFLKTDFGKVHLAVMLLGVINVGLAIALKLQLVPYAVALPLHQWSGMLLLPTLLVLPALFKRRRNLYAALKTRVLIQRRDVKAGKTAMILAKAVILLMLLGFLMQTVSAILMKTGLSGRMYPAVDVYSLHTGMIYVMPALVVLHAIFILLATRRSAAAKR